MLFFAHFASERFKLRIGTSLHVCNKNTSKRLKIDKRKPGSKKNQCYPVKMANRKPLIIQRCKGTIFIQNYKTIYLENALEANYL